MRDKINNCFFFSVENVNVCLFMLAHQYGQFNDNLFTLLDFYKVHNLLQPFGSLLFVTTLHCWDEEKSIIMTIKTI